jgi:chemotaxis protein CheX
MLLLKLIIEKDAGNMSVSKHIQTVLNGTVSSIKTILPMQINVSAPSVSAEPFVQQEMGVLIGIVGDLKGRIIIDGSSEIFGNIGAAMFGMPLEGEMLESFTGEFGNMIAGNLCTIVGQEGLELDITPPTVMVGNTKLYGFQKIFRLPTSIEGIGNLTLLLTMDEE